MRMTSGTKTAIASIMLVRATSSSGHAIKLKRSMAALGTEKIETGTVVLLRAPSRFVRTVGGQILTDASLMLEDANSRIAFLTRSPVKGESWRGPSKLSGPVVIRFTH